MSSDESDNDNESQGAGLGSMAVAAGVGVGVGALLAWLLGRSSPAQQCNATTQPRSSGTSRPNAAYSQRPVKCEQCSVCIEDIQPIVQLPCGHRFHDGCVKRWLAIKDECPNCRRPTQA